jgi:hypothetical protein
MYHVSFHGEEMRGGGGGQIVGGHWDLDFLLEFQARAITRAWSNTIQYVVYGKHIAPTLQNTLVCQCLWKQAMYRPTVTARRNSYANSVDSVQF